MAMITWTSTDQVDKNIASCAQPWGPEWLGWFHQLPWSTAARASLCQRRGLIAWAQTLLLLVLHQRWQWLCPRLERHRRSAAP